MARPKCYVAERMRETMAPHPGGLIDYPTQLYRDDMLSEGYTDEQIDNRIAWSRANEGWLFSVIGPLEPIPQIFQPLYGCDDLSEIHSHFPDYVDTM